MPRKMELEEFKVYCRLLNRTDVLVESSYTDASHKAEFIDPDYGSYFAIPAAIKFGKIKGHKKRQGERISKTKRKKK